jgi:hypothetical protein
VLNSSPGGTNKDGNTTCTITRENVNFTPGSWYKVQGRYIKTDLNNKKTYSEWSTVSLIKAINQPTETIDIMGLTESDTIS